MLTLFLLKLFDGVTGREPFDKLHFPLLLQFLPDVVSPLAEGCVVGLNGLQFVGADVDPPKPMVTALVIF